jgi:N,N'-diacetylchitobiose transport system substrate-binding protein
MHKTHLAAVGAIGLSLAMALTGCSGNGTPAEAGGGSGVVPTPKASGETLTVWAMNGDLSEDVLGAINAEFTKLTGAKVKVQTQDWVGITTKVTTALATSTPPDVIDLGNTQVAGYAANGGLLDLTSYKEDLQQGQSWLGGLEEPATIAGQLYGVPSFAGARAVIYNKTLWKAAGVTETPKTYDELTAALDKVKAADAASDFSAFYYPGQYWYGGIQWIWDAGGDIATEADKKWTSGFGSPAAQTGLSDFKAFQAQYSSVASQTLDTDKPDQDQIFADGKTSAILGNSWEISVIQKANPKLTDDDLGTFPFPGKSGNTQPVMLAGSVWGIATKTQHKDLALLWAKIAASPDIQNDHVFGHDGWIPNSTEGIDAAQTKGVPPLAAGFFAAATNSKATPAAANWATIEGERSIHQFFQSIASGAKTPADAAKGFDDHLDSVLNAK